MRLPGGQKCIPVPALIKLLQSALEIYGEEGKELLVSVNMVRNLGLTLGEGPFVAYIDIPEETLDDLVAFFKRPGDPH